MKGATPERNGIIALVALTGTVILVVRGDVLAGEGGGAGG
jgi:hypothetical protein